MIKKERKILFTGGGTAGSVTPLLAIAEELREESGVNKFLWLGTKHGPEKKMVEQEKIKFEHISNGKFRRYFSFKNFIEPLFVVLGFFQSLFIVLKWKPTLVISAGSFVSVPVVWAAWLLGKPSLIHQQDVRPGLANKLMAPFAKKITVTFIKSLDDYRSKAVLVGNPIRRNLLSAMRNTEKDKAFLNFDLEPNIPTILIMGGGTGALAINKLTEQALPELVKFVQIIHIAGKGKNIKFKHSRYRQFLFLGLKELAEAYCLANLVISRAGMGSLTELSFLNLPTILIPIPRSHQEDNAAIFAKTGAAIVFDQDNLSADKLTAEIKNVLNNSELSCKLSHNMGQVIKRGASQEVIKLINRLAEKRI